MYNTTYLPWANFGFYVITNATGFIYTNISNLNCRSPVTRSGRNELCDFLATILVAMITFFVAPIIVLRSQDDLSSTFESVPYGKLDVLSYNAFWFLAFLSSHVLAFLVSRFLVFFATATRAPHSLDIV